MVKNYKISPFRFWCHKVLPLVYDDSLSYYEVLCKVVDYLNTVIDETNELYDEFIKLKEYVDNYFNSTDFQGLVNNKLDEMAEDGTLDRLINQEIFGELSGKVNKLYRHEVPEKEREAYKDMIRRIIASYFYATSFCTSVVKTNSPALKVVCKYNNDTGTYMGILGKAEYNPNDVETIGNTPYHVMYHDCTSFVSLITKGRAFDNSPYYYSFITASPDDGELYLLAQEVDDQNKPYTFDCLNNGSARYWAYIMNASGNGMGYLSVRDSNGFTINEDNIALLETGDIVFTGGSNKQNSGGNYNGIAHCSIYVKTLEELNEVSTTYGMTFKPYDGADNSHPEYGYVCECTFNKADGYTDAIRITPLWEFLNHPLGTETFRVCTACAGISNAMISNKAMRMTHNYKRNYHYTDFYDCNYNPNQSMHNTVMARLDNSNGEFYARAFKMGAIVLPSKFYDLNQVRDTGCWAVSTTAALNQITNYPPFAPKTYFTLWSFAGRSDQPYGLTQLLVVRQSSGMRAYMRSSNAGRFATLVWSEWTQIGERADAINNISLYQLPSGKFFATDGANITNKPADISGSFFVEVMQYGEQKIIRCTPDNMPNKIYQCRYYTDTGVASAWYSVTLS